MTKPTEPTEQVVRGRRGMFVWAAIGLVAVTATVTATIVYGLASRDEVVAYRDSVDQANEVIAPLCDAAGGRVTADPGAQQACANVARGKPAVPVIELPPARDGADGADGVGITYTRQIDRCYVEIGLSTGAAPRFGPFCGATGKTGPTGKIGPTGTPGAPGATGKPGVNGVNGVDGQDAAPAVGIRDTRTRGCMVDVALTDGTVRTVGPFCASPTAETRVYSDGTQERCSRDGGTDAAPRYTCTVTPPPGRGGLLPTR